MAAWALAICTLLLGGPYQVPQLTTLEDAPGLRLGYALPISRLAIQEVR